MKGEPPLGNNAVVLVWMDGYIGGDAQLIQPLSQASRAVPCVARP